MQALMGDLVERQRRGIRPERPACLQDVARILLERQAELRQRGIEHLSVFGSTARGDNTANSDINLLVVMSDEPRMSLTKFANLRFDIEDMLSHPVDLVELRLLKPNVAGLAVRDAVKVF